MPTDPIRELILQNCVTALWLIDGTGAYYSTLADVQRGASVPDDLTSLPVAFVDEGDEAFVRDTNLLITRTLPVTVEVRVRSADGDLPTVTNRMLADIERAMTSDPTRGGLAKQTIMVGNSIRKDPAPGVLGSVIVAFEIQFYTLRGNPASKG
jgi:hypothetical protein